MTDANASARARIPRTAVVAAAAVGGLVLLLLYLQGTLGGHKVTPGVVPLGTTSAPVGSNVTVVRREVDDLVDWPGTVTSRSVANLAPKVMARVLEVRVSAGATVKAGEVLAVLDDRDVRSRTEQARAALTAAQAQAAQVEADQRRTRTLFQKQAATQQDLEAIDARAKTVRAQVAQARDAVTEAEVLLGETTVRAPFDGVVAARLVDPGDTASPATPVLVVHDPTSLRLEARIAERCAGPLNVGMVLPVHVDTLDHDLEARIDEIAPAADPRSRTVLVKAALPADPGLRPGAFGSLRAPCGRHAALLIPATAVTRTGQLESVRLLVDGAARVRHIRTGKPYGDQVEVLSGLQEGEQVLLGP